MRSLVGYIHLETGTTHLGKEKAPMEGGIDKGGAKIWDSQIEEGDEVVVTIRSGSQALSVRADSLLICALDGDSMMTGVFGDGAGLHNVFTAAIEMAMEREQLAHAALCATMGTHRQGRHGADE